MMDVKELAEDMFELVKSVQGKKKLKSGDIIKEMMKKHGDKVDKKLCKLGVRELVDNGRCVYTYFGGSFVELPPEEGVLK